MNSKATKRFWKCYKLLPVEIKESSKKAYVRFKDDPWHPSIHFKRIHSTQPIYSVRINKDYRAVGVLKNGKIVWFWIGSHSEYDRLLKNL